MTSGRSPQLPFAKISKMRLTRRQLLKGVALSAAGVGLGGGYAVVEPFRLNVTRYAISPPGWTAGLNVRLVVLADLHAVDPWLTLDRVRHIVERANALEPDAILLLGDYVGGQRFGRLSVKIPNEGIAGALSNLKAPLGVHAVLGNHDWWDDPEVQRRRAGPVPIQLAFEAAGIAVYHNMVLRLQKAGLPFWIAGLGDQWALYPRPENYQKFLRGGKFAYEGLDDLAGTLSLVTDDAPVVLMAHEPDIFPQVPDRVSLTLSGHTHGGQVRIAGFAPVVPSKYGRRFVYGHIVEEGRNLIVSGGLGCSGLPIRFGSPPEIVVVDLARGTNFA